MGYTHYWNRTEREIPLNLWRQATAKIEPLVKKHARKYGLRDVKVTDDVIYFNGAYETFMVQRVFQRPDFVPESHRNDYFAFCKTNYEAYDDVVVACLLILAETLKPVGFRWSSDGSWPEEHRNGINLAGLTAKTAIPPSRD